MSVLITAEQCEAWREDPSVKEKYRNNYYEYRSHCNRMNQLASPAATTPALSNGAHGRHLPASREADNEEKPMTQPNNTAAGEAALAQIKIWQEEDRQKAAMARMAAINPEQAWRAEFAASAALQKEFRAVEPWIAYKKAQARGLCK